MVLSDSAAANWDMSYEGYNLIIFRSKMPTTWALDSDIDPLFKGNCVNEIFNFFMHGGVFKFYWESNGVHNSIRVGVIDNIAITDMDDFKNFSLNVSGLEMSNSRTAGSTYVLGKFEYDSETDSTAYIEISYGEIALN